MPFAGGGLLIQCRISLKLKALYVYQVEAVEIIVWSGGGGGGERDPHKILTRFYDNGPPDDTVSMQYTRYTAQ